MSASGVQINVNGYRTCEERIGLNYWSQVLTHGLIFRVLCARSVEKMVATAVPDLLLAAYRRTQ